MLPLLCEQGKPRAARPTTSCNASVVGAITRAASAPPKRRSMPNSVRKVDLPHTRSTPSATSAVVSVASSLTCRVTVK